MPIDKQNSTPKKQIETLLQLDNVCIGYQQETVLSGVSLSIKKGEIACILGPSGSGKTSLLRAIAGFLPVNEGSIKINSQLVSNASLQVAPNERSIGLVFQDFALFPHMTVIQNVEFGLQKLPKALRTERAQEYMHITGIQALANKYPSQLSGGQQQRVAIARAIAPQPDLLLMDEAFSSLDPMLREQVAQDMRAIIKKLGLTALLVTHDQTEAFAFADLIGVVAEQSLQQFSSAYALYHEPSSFFVANFIGEGAFIKGTVKLEKNGFVVSTGLGKLPLHANNTQALDAQQPKEFKAEQIIKVLLRPDDVIHDDASPIKAQIVGRNFRGAFIRYKLLLPNTFESVLCFAPSHHDHAIGECFGIRAEVEHIIYFDE